MVNVFLVLFYWISLVYAKTWLFVGDSLTEGYGLSKEQAFPAKLGELWKSNKQEEIQVLNIGVSGQTSTEALSQIQYFKDRKFAMIFIAIGANDGLRGQSLALLEKNLRQLVDWSKKRSPKVVLAGMRIPSNYGLKYSKEFSALFEKVATQEKVLFFPFLLKDVAGVKELNLSDAIHPNEQGYEKVAENLFQFLDKKL